MMKQLDNPDSPPLSAAEIVTIVEEMQGSESQTKATEFGEKYPRFLEQCPVLFRKACKPGLDMNMLRFMVEASKDDCGDEHVGERLAKKYVFRK